MAFEFVPFISARSQQFSCLYPCFTPTQDILAAGAQLAQDSSSTPLLVPIFLAGAVPCGGHVQPPGMDS